MIISGKITTGVLRGKPLIDRIYFRLVGLLGFSPFKGTLDVQAEKEIDLGRYATKSVEHRLQDGSLLKECWLAPINLRIKDKQNSPETRYECWAMQQCEGIYQKNIIEIIAKDKLRDLFGLKDGDKIKIEFTAQEKPKKKTPLSFLKKNK